jgi:hypothetical protein
MRSTVRPYVQGSLIKDAHHAHVLDACGLMIGCRSPTHVLVCAYLSLCPSCWGVMVGIRTPTIFAGRAKSAAFLDRMDDWGVQKRTAGLTASARTRCHSFLEWKWIEG